MALGWGVVGCGWVGRDLAAPAIAATPGARLVALCDPDPGRLAAAGAIFPDASRCSDVAALLADDAVEAVYVATPNHTHAEIVVAAAGAGRHVLCEKPMATTPHDATAMVDACAAAGVRYATAFDQRHHAAHRALRRLVADGALGTITSVRVHYACWLDTGWSPWPSEPHDNWRIEQARSGGGALIDLAPHSVDLLPYLLGDEWVALMGLEQRCVHRYDVADGAVLCGQFAGGALASISVSYNCPDQFPRRRLELYGTAAMAEAVDTMGQTAGGRLSVVDAVDGRRLEVVLDDDRNPFEVQIESFTRHVRDGDALPVAPTTDARHVALLDAAMREVLACR